MFSTFKNHLNLCINPFLSDDKKKTIFNMAVIGEIGSSKTRLLDYYKTGHIIKNYCDDVIIGAQFLSKDFDQNNKKYHFLIWNLAEHQKFVPIIESYINRAVCILIVVEMERDSVVHLQSLLNENGPFKERVKDPLTVVAVIGCYKNKDKIKLSHQDLIQFAQKNQIDASLCFDVNMNNINEINASFDAIFTSTISIYKNSQELTNTDLQIKK